MKAIVLLAIVALTLSPIAGAASPSELVRAQLLADVSAVAPSTSFLIGVRIQIKPQWHIYWANPGETGTATQIDATGPAGFTFGSIQWPIPAKLNTEMGLSYAYENEVLLLIPVTVSKDVAIGTEATLTAHVKWLACHDTCIEGEARLSIKIPVAAQAAPANQELFAQWRALLPVALDSAMAGKLIAKREQSSATTGNGAAVPLPAVTVTWHSMPAKVDWYPLATPAVMIEDVKVEKAGDTTVIRFKPTVYKPEKVPGGVVDGVLVFDDARGNRQGIAFPVGVGTAK